MASQLAPGEQPIQSAWLRRYELFLLLIAVSIIWVFNTRSPMVVEYRMYFLDSRESITMDWTQIDKGWTEELIKQRFTANHPQCYDDSSGPSGTDRRCAIDIRGLNGVPAMYVSFWFAGSELAQVSSSHPWYAHRQVFGSIIHQLGAPIVAQDSPVSGVRLVGWKLPGGGALFFNRDPVRVLDTNATLWISAEKCREITCVR